LDPWKYVLQTASAVSVLYVGLAPPLDRRKRTLCLIAVALMLGAALLGYLKERDSDRAFRENNARLSRMEQDLIILRNRLFGEEAAAVMNTPRQRPPAPPEMVTDEAITIDDPAGLVDARNQIRGRSKGVQSPIWAIVHPTTSGAYWVQPPASPTASGEWTTGAYFGQEGQDRGVEFEFRAIANPADELHEGEILSDWPKAGQSSSVKLVTRR
jgi:hypothetical protein